MGQKKDFRVEMISSGDMFNYAVNLPCVVCREMCKLVDEGLGQDRHTCTGTVNKLCVHCTLFA